MVDIDGLYGYNKSSATNNKLLAAYGNDIINVDTGAGYGAGLTTSSKGEFATYLDYCFFVNGVDATRSFDGSTWTTTGARNRCPIAKYVKVFGTKLYLGYVTIGSSIFPSRVWSSDLPYNNGVRWGLEYGTNLVQSASSAVITSSGALFKTYGIKVGDPVFILDGANAGQYIVQTIDSETQITLTGTLTNAVPGGSTYIIGSNYFDVRTDDNDYMRGLGENSGRLLIFKLGSLSRYNGASLFGVSGAPGTSSGRSIANIKQYTFYFHGSESTRTGVYMYDGSEVLKISTPIQPYIDGIAASMYPNIVGWREGNWYRCYVGDITNTQRNISMSNVVLSFDVALGRWSIDPIEKTVKCSATFLESNSEKIFIGDDSSGVFQIPSGYSFNGSPIEWIVETGPHYPEGSEFLLNFTRVQIISRDSRGTRVRYKLYNHPTGVDDNWWTLGEITDDKTEFFVPPSHNRASGIEIRFEEDGIDENTQYIEKISIFYTVETTTIAKI